MGTLFLSQKIRAAFSCEGEPVAAFDSPLRMSLHRERPALAEA
jgi:hypothetical protein